jgi:hypothetical protein
MKLENSLRLHVSTAHILLGDSRMEDGLSKDTIWAGRQWRDLLDQLDSHGHHSKTYDIDRLRKTCQPQIIVLPDQHVQPSDESEHVAIIIDLSQTILSVTLELVPDIPLVECDLDRSRG